MVQITNILVVAAIIVPAFAAPVLETREPKGFGSPIRTGSKVAGGASLGLTVGGMLQGRKEQKLEAREPRLTGAQAKGIAKGVLAVGKTAKSAVELGITTAPLFPHRKQRRDVEEIEAREPRITGAQLKTITHGALAIGKTAKSGIEFGATVAPLLPHKQRRDMEELDARRFRVSPFTLEPVGYGLRKSRVSPFTLGPVGHGLARFAGFAGALALMHNQKPQQRDFEDNELDARFRTSPSAIKTIGHLVGGAAGFAGTVAILNTKKQQQRDFDDSEYLDARYDEILDARDPRLSMKRVLKTAGKVAKTASKVALHFLREDEMDLAEREFDDVKFDTRDEDEMIEVVERDFDDAELVEAREPGHFGGNIKMRAKAVKHFIRDEETGDIYVIREAADIDELD